MAPRVFALLASLLPLAASAFDPTPFLRRDAVGEILISPDGQYIATTVPMSDRTTIAILRRSDLKLTGGLNVGANTILEHMHWVSDHRLIASVAEKFGALDQPRPTGELIAVDADGKNAEMLVGWRSEEMSAGTRIRPKKGDKVAAWLIDSLPDDDRNVLVAIQPLSTDPWRKIERLDVRSGRRTTVGRGPIRNAWFQTDNAGTVRFGYGHETDNDNQLFHRATDDAEWTLVNRETQTGIIEIPLGFAPDNRIAYLLSQRTEGPDHVVAYDTVTGERRTVLEDDNTDPTDFLYRGDSQVLVGATFMDGLRRVEMLDPKSADARLQRSLEAAFQGQAVRITSTTKDGNLALVQVWSDRSPGDYYLYDNTKKKVDFLLARRDWLDPEKMAAVRPVALKARDGLALHGYLTLPPGSEARNLPLLVMPHGGPFGIHDRWGFDPQTQLFAAAGYAVLQVNFRGSGNHGRAFEQAGAREWGGRMQDDITDATRWAIAEGIADARRICIHGASYGAYAALMGAVREPELYRCASGLVGVYDLGLMHRKGDMQESRSTQTWMREWIGEPDALAAVSPVNLAARIKVPVLLAAGKEDQRAPVMHTEWMERSLKKAGARVEAHYYAGEGHGFYTLANDVDYHQKLLAFLRTHLGDGTSAGTAAGGG